MSKILYFGNLPFTTTAADLTKLVKPFSEVVSAMIPLYLIRAAGGLLYLAGFLIMVWNIVQTVRGKLRDEKPLSDTPHDPDKDRPLPPRGGRSEPDHVPANEPEYVPVAAE